LFSPSSHLSPSAVAPPPSFVIDPLLFSSLLPRSSFSNVPPSPNLLAPPHRHYLVAFHPQPLHRYRLYNGSHIQFSLDPICRPLFLPSSDVPCHLVLWPSSFLPVPPSSPSSNRKPACGPQAMPHILRAVATSFLVDYSPPRPLLKLLLSGFFLLLFSFSLFFYFPSDL
jgi:hypothetical protein